VSDTLIDAKTRIGPLLDEHPYLLETIAGHAPELGKLRNPLLRRTFARLATLGDAARLGGVELEPLLTRLAAEIAARNGNGKAASEGHGEAYRIDELKAMLRELHNGTPAAELTGRFARLLETVSAAEIAETEQQLVAEGLPEEEIKKLCDVHAAVFRGQPEQRVELHLPDDHPLAELQRSNRGFASAAADLGGMIGELGQPPSREAFDERRGDIELALRRLAAVEQHYAYKENRLFPLLEGYGVEAPPKVMWAVQDDARELLRRALAAVREGDVTQAAAAVPELLRTVTEMITKEEQILFPLCLELLDEQDWAGLGRGEQPAGTTDRGSVSTGSIPLPVGALTAEQLGLVLGNLPFDITYVDEHDRVRYYSEGHRIFPREPEVIGRKVHNCHPPKSVHIVEQIITEFREGRRNLAEFWLDFRGRFVHISYIALRDAGGQYRGVLEVAQDATHVRSLEGQRRLLEW